MGRSFTTRLQLGKEFWVNQSRWVTEAEMVAVGEAGEDVNSRGARVSTAQASKRTRACLAQGGR